MNTTTSDKRQSTGNEGRMRGAACFLISFYFVERAEAVTVMSRVAVAMAL
jgi:hypothetical protein